MGESGPRLDAAFNPTSMGFDMLAIHVYRALPRPYTERVPSGLSRSLPFVSGLEKGE